MSTQRLELTWIGKNHPDYDIANIEPRILIENPELSHGDQSSENMLIHGDNLLALKALLPEYEGKVKCIYIDPPYNTGNAFEHYDDSVEHSTWLSLMKPRLDLFKSLLANNGILAIQIDDNEYAKLYLIVAEIFWWKNIKTICVKMSEATWVKMASVNKSWGIPKLKEYIILASKSGIKWLNIEKVPKDKWDNEYKTICIWPTRDELEFVKWVMEDENRSNNDLEDVEKIFSNIKFLNANQYFKEINPNESINDDWLFENAWRIVQFATITWWARDIAVEKKLVYSEVPPVFSIITSTWKMYLVKGEFNHETELPRCKLLFADLYLEVNPWDFWQDIKTTWLDNEWSIVFKNWKKPERLIKRIIWMSSSKNDLVLDSFLGSGTTAAVAHKMGRRWIGIEMGDHAYTHCKVRLDKVIDGEDSGGITKSVDWKWGGGYKFYELAPSFITTDEFGNRVIDEFYDDAKLVRAMCKLLGYTFSPSDTEYYKQGVGTGRNYLYVTTQMMSAGVIRQIASHLGADDTLTIATRKYESGAESADSRITIKKIPQSVLKACQYGKKEYLLPIRESAIEEVEWEDEEESNIS